MEKNRAVYGSYAAELERLKAVGSLRVLPQAESRGRWISRDGRRMLNLSSNDYLGLASERSLAEEFADSLHSSPSGGGWLPLSSSSSRLLTGNHEAYGALEERLAAMYGRESALVLSSGYHMNSGLLPALCDRKTLILADKLVHASLIDGIRLCEGRCIRFRHQDYAQVESILEKESGAYERIFIVTESIFSMDGDLAPLQRLVEIKRRWPSVMLYVDEAHAVGVRGANGLGLAEECGCIGDIDLLCGTFGKALASVGAYVVCDRVLKEYLVNKMRTLIFTTALPPVNVAWSLFIMERLQRFGGRREHLDRISSRLREAFIKSGMQMPSGSHIIPMIIGSSTDAVLRAEDMQRHGFYVLPIRPPTVPEGTSRLRFSLTAALEEEDITRLIDNI
ncbi:MAG TPA: 8-amino-7-oxononanoate synthase [Candidatus Coprenecus stercoravium]|uniref:8-amino-7-oxononanoate synthase n=1 Tax=Candidatus Coprenecus stercoravium TaxID=2840735 RepID=A0A9D2GR39_9BACT|nr:8-amino-7-oxononanoate synthase [Candidatus Coprenecus stercoravium]